MSRNLSAHAVAAREAYSASTHRAWAGDTKRFAEWCLPRRLTPLPADPDTLVRYVRALGRRLKPATVRRYLASIAHMHIAADLPDPTRAVAVRLAVKACARRSGTRQRQARGITADDEERMLAAAGTDLRGLRDAAVLLVGRDLLARRSELVRLAVEDVTEVEGGAGVALIRRSKTDQAGEGNEQYVSPRSLAALREWLAKGKVDTGPVFRKIDRWGRVWPAREVEGSDGQVEWVGLEAGEVAVILRRLARAAGLDSAGISGHSLRVGMAQDLAAEGVELPELMHAGRWKSATMPGRYVEKQRAQRSAVAKYRASREG